MTLIFGFDGESIHWEDISTLKEALSFAEEQLKGKPRNVAHLSASPKSFVVSLHDGNKWTEEREFPTSFTIEGYE